VPNTPTQSCHLFPVSQTTPLDGLVTGNVSNYYSMFVRMPGLPYNNGLRFPMGLVHPEITRRLLRGEIKTLGGIQFNTVAFDLAYFAEWELYVDKTEGIGSLDVGGRYIQKTPNKEVYQTRWRFFAPGLAGFEIPSTIDNQSVTFWSISVAPGNVKGSNGALVSDDYPTLFTVQEIASERA
jgi:hypothetical protein